MAENSYNISDSPDIGTFAGNVARRLQFIYKSAFHEGIVNSILALTNQQFPEQSPWNEKDVMLITYGNSITTRDEKPLQTLRRFLEEKLTGHINNVHILPFFPFTSDDGFAISDYQNVNPALGSWEDVSALSENFFIMSDLVINHVSSSHPWFKNYLENIGPGKNYFIEEEPDGDYSRVIRPRSTNLFTEFNTKNGPRKVWTTFSADQVDLNFANPEVLLEMIRIMIFYISKGVRLIRLDAIAFLWKNSGTNCLHLAETHEIVKLFRDIVSYVSPGTLILTETNVPNKENWSYFGNGDEAHMVYQFSLPPLLLHALYSGGSNYLREWAKEIPGTAQDQTFLNYTASHDGIGVRPLEGILPAEQITKLIDGMIGFGGLISMRSNKDGSVSPYEMNITYFDALKGTIHGEDQFHEARFLCSQAVMLSMKGIPALYIHSLLSTPNDHEGVKLTGQARTINRKQLDRYDLNQILSSDTIHKRVFQELLKMIGIRTKYSVFHPGSEQEILDYDDRIFAFVRISKANSDKIYCISNLTDTSVLLNMKLLKKQKGYDLLSGEALSISDHILFKPYQTRWIRPQSD